MRCEEARRRLLAAAWDHQAGRHLESCAACFEALESNDRLVRALRDARPADSPAPERLADAVLTRWRPGRPARARGLTIALAVMAIVTAGALELLVGAEPARLRGVGAVAGALVDGSAGPLTLLVAVRSALAAQPAVLMAFTAVTVAACGLWLRLTLRPPAWRWAR